MEQFKPRFKFAEELGMSYPTFRRRIKALGIDLPKGLLSPQSQRLILEALGFPNDGIERQLFLRDHPQKDIDRI